MQRHIDYPRWQPLLSKGLAKLFITAAEGWSRTYRMRRLLSEERVAARGRARGTRSLPRGSVSLHVLLCPDATPTGPLRGRERRRRPRSPGPGADVPCVGGPLRLADPLAQDHAVGAGGARSEPRRGPRADR